jgi:hypothetical protein
VAVFFDEEACGSMVDILNQIEGILKEVGLGEEEQV